VRFQPEVGFTKEGGNVVEFLLSMELTSKTEKLNDNWRGLVHPIYVHTTNTLGKVPEKSGNIPLVVVYHASEKLPVGIF
jgi:hypothetical protein